MSSVWSEQPGNPEIHEFTRYWLCIHCPCAFMPVNIFHNCSSFAFVVQPADIISHMRHVLVIILGRSHFSSKLSHPCWLVSDAINCVTLMMSASSCSHVLMNHDVFCLLFLQNESITWTQRYFCDLLWSRTVVCCCCATSAYTLHIIQQRSTQEKIRSNLVNRRTDRQTHRTSVSISCVAFTGKTGYVSSRETFSMWQREEFNWPLQTTCMCALSGNVMMSCQL